MGNTNLTTGARLLRFPRRSRSASDYEALRSAKKQGYHEWLESAVHFQESAASHVGQQLETVDVDPERFFEILAIPSQQLDLAVEDVIEGVEHEGSVSELRYPIELEEVEELEELCSDGLSALNCTPDDPRVFDARESGEWVFVGNDRPGREIACEYLLEIRTMCEMALSLGVRLQMSKIA